jgi:hypothetical protein
MRRWLAWGDAASLLLFTAVGLRFHMIPVGPEEILRTAVPLLAAWFLAAALTGTYRAPGVLRLLATWLVAVPLGLAARHIWLGRTFGPGFLIFVGVSLGLTLAFVGGWRLAAFLVRAGIARARRAGQGNRRTA